MRERGASLSVKKARSAVIDSEPIYEFEVMTEARPRSRSPLASTSEDSMQDEASNRSSQQTVSSTPQSAPPQAEEGDILTSLANHCQASPTRGRPVRHSFALALQDDVNMPSDEEVASDTTSDCEQSSIEVDELSRGRSRSLSPGPRSRPERGGRSVRNILEKAISEGRTTQIGEVGSGKQPQRSMSTALKAQLLEARQTIGDQQKQLQACKAETKALKDKLASYEDKMELLEDSVAACIAALRVGRRTDTDTLIH